MSDTAAPSSRSFSRDQIAQYQKLASYAGLPLTEAVTQVLLESLAAGVTPTGLATVLNALCKRQTQLPSATPAPARERAG